jgi:hypothetical protein
MKPCRDVRKIEKLIRHHTEMAILHNQQVMFHQQRIAVLQEYIHELHKPGFRVQGWIKAGTTRRSETFATISANTFSAE